MKYELRFGTGCVVLLMLCVTAGSARAQDVFRSVDENGVVTFSDVQTADAVRLELAAPVVRENALAEQRTLIEQQLEVAKALEASRLAREASRTERLEALAASQPRTVYHRESDQDRYEGWGYRSSGYWGGGYLPGYRPHPHPPWRPGYPDRPTHPVEPPALPPPGGRPVPLPPLKSD